MNSNIMECDESKLKLLLAADEHTIEHDPWMQHVEHCSQCQSRLRELAADDNDWRMTVAVLASHDDDVPCFAQDRDASSSWSESMVKQLLDPPSHPEMLGRLGRYEMERMIGSGGMGIVFKAFDTELNRVVAVKLLAPHLAARGSARKRFAREARAAAGVRDDHVVPIFNVESEHEPPFLVMQYVAGGSLQEKLDRDGPLEVAEILRIGLQTSKGLAAAHAQGLIHRDVKPSNILLDEGVERALLTDFGLARAEDDACLTRSGFHPGTPHYMSPEQVRGDAIDGRSDLFSLGCVLYSLCTGHSPFRADTSYAVMRRITDEEPRSIRETNSEVPEWLEAIVMKLLSKNRDDRFDSAGKVAELLEGCLAHVQEPTTAPLPPFVAELVKSFGPEVADSRSIQSLGGCRFPPIRKMIAAAAFAFFAFAGTIIYLETGKGTLRIESQADDVPIRIVQGNKVVEELTVSKSGESVRIAAGTYEVEIGGEIDGLLLDRGKVVLSRGENEVVRVARTSRETAQVLGTPTVAPVSFDAPFRCRVRWGEGIYESAFVTQGDFIAEVVELDADLLGQTENQLSAAKNQVNSIQAKVQASESNLSAAETTVETLESQRKAYVEVKSQLETAAAATTASAKNQIEAKKAELAEQRAVLEQNQTNLARQQELFEEALISRSKFQAAEYEVRVAGARVKKAEADLQTAESDLIARQNEDQAKKEKTRVDVDLAISSLDKAKGDAARAEGELAKAQRDLKQAQKTVVELEMQLARQRKRIIHAPFSGIVTQLVNRIVNEGDRICLFSPEAADTQPAGQENASPGAIGASDDVTISTLMETPLAQITETLKAVFALKHRFQEIQAELHAVREGEGSKAAIARLEQEKTAARSARDMVVAILKSQLEAAEQQNESQRTVLGSVRLGVQQGLLDPPSLSEAELAVVMTAAEIRQLELLIQHCRSLGIDEVTASQDDKTFALSILNVRLEAEQKNHRFQMDRTRLAKRRFELGDGDLYDVQEAEQAEADIAAEVRKLEVLIEAYQNEEPNSIGLPPSLVHGTSISATPTIEEATKQFNLQSAIDRETLFDPPIGELSVRQMRDAFAKTANEYRKIGEHAIANSLQRIAETGKLPSDALSPVYASGPYGKDQDGKLIQKQIVPMLMLPDGRGGARLVPLRSAELIYNKHGRSSKRYGDLFEESQQKKADDGDKKTGIEDRTNTRNDPVTEKAVSDDRKTLLVHLRGSKELLLADPSKPNIKPQPFTGEGVTLPYSLEQPGAEACFHILDSNFRSIRAVVRLECSEFLPEELWRRLGDQPIELSVSHDDFVSVYSGNLADRVVYLPVKTAGDLLQSKDYSGIGRPNDVVVDARLVGGQPFFSLRLDPPTAADKVAASHEQIGPNFNSGRSTKDYFNRCTDDELLAALQGEWIPTQWNYGEDTIVSTDENKHPIIFNGKKFVWHLTAVGSLEPTQIKMQLQVSVPTAEESPGPPNLDDAPVRVLRLSGDESFPDGLLGILRLTTGGELTLIFPDNQLQSFRPGEYVWLKAQRAQDASDAKRQQSPSQESEGEAEFRSAFDSDPSFGRVSIKHAGQRQTIENWNRVLQQDDLTREQQIFAWWRIGSLAAYNFRPGQGETADEDLAAKAFRKVLSICDDLICRETLNAATVYATLGEGTREDQGSRMEFAKQWLATRTDAMVVQSAWLVNHNGYAIDRRLMPGGMNLQTEAEKAEYLSNELANARESVTARAAMAVTKEGRQVLSDAVLKKLADRVVAAAGSPTWKLHHVDKLPAVLVDNSLGYRITLRRTWKEYSSLRQQKETPPDELGSFELKHENWEFLLFPSDRQVASRRADASTPAASGSRLTQSLLADLESKLHWQAISSPYHTQAVCMGEGQDLVWYSLGTLFGQETMREKLKLTGGDDRIDLLIAGMQIEDKGNMTSNSCQRLLERLGDEALRPMKTAIEQTQDPNALRRLIGSLAFIRTDAANELLMRLHESDNKEICKAADYALVHRPLRPAAKSAYLDMLLQHRHVDVACEGAVHFRWKEALPILINLTSHPESLRELSWTTPARRELEGKPIEHKLIGAQQTIIADRTDPNDVRDAWQTLTDSDDFEAVVLIGIELATYTNKGPQKRINDFGFRVLLTRPRDELASYLKDIGKVMPAENANQVQQLLRQLQQSEQLKRLQSHGILVTPGGIGGASHRYVVPSEFLGGYAIDDLLQYCVSFSPKSEIVFFGPVITADQFRQFHLLLPASNVRRMAAVWLNIVATVSEDESERKILRVSDLGSPAREIGLQVDDVIVGIGQFRWPKSESRDPYNAAMLTQRPGQKSKIVVDRDGKLLTFPVTWEESTAHRLLCGDGMPTTQRGATQSAKPDVDETSTTDNMQALSAMLASCSTHSITQIVQLPRTDN